jgi:ATP-dependent Zn protease
MTASMAGADLARVVRDAKKKARREDRAVTLSDLTSFLPDLIKIDGQYRHSVAVHEVGHALIGRALKIGQFFCVELARQINPRLELQSMGQAVFGIPRVLIRNAQRYRNDICFQLGGIAAEQLIFGYHTDGSGLGPTSDLATATNLAVQMETQLGMGAGFHHFVSDKPLGAVGLAEPWLMKNVEAILREELARATVILSEQRNLLLTIAKELDHVGFVLADRFDEICEETAVNVLSEPDGIKLEPENGAGAALNGDSQGSDHAEVRR